MALKRQIRVEPLTRELFIKYDGEEPPFSVRGFAVVDGDEPICIACVSQFTTPTFLMFDSKGDISSIEVKRQLLKGWSKVKLLLGGEVLAHQDKDKPSSDSFLRHFGFEPLDGEFYIYRGD